MELFDGWCVGLSGINQILDLFITIIFLKFLCEILHSNTIVQVVVLVNVTATVIYLDD